MAKNERAAKSERRASTTSLHVEVTLSIEGDWKQQPLQAVKGITEGIENLEGYRRQAVELARADGRSWAEIGQSLGVSRQAAWERFSTD